VEGGNQFYGGTLAGDNSGRIRYLRVMHSGFEIAPGNELNGITLAGVGTGTLVDYVQVHNSSDDGIEWFGGTVNAKHLVLTGNDDDSMDTDVGFNGAIQFAIVIQRQPGDGAPTGRGDRINEYSGSTRTPASNPKLANFTFIGRPSGGGDALVLNTGTNSVYANGIVVGSPACLDVDDATTLASFNSVLFACATPFRDDGNLSATQGFFTAGANNNSAYTPTLTNLFINGANETAATPVANLTAISPFFTQVPYIGAVRNASDTWYAGWTCGLPGGTAC